MNHHCITIAICTLIIAVCAYYLTKGSSYMRALIKAFKGRTNYRAIVRDCANEYIQARNVHYTARDARAHVRQHARYTYPGLSKEEHNYLAREAIEMANEEMSAARTA